jgi:putative ABC transport system permease protein
MKAGKLMRLISGNLSRELRTVLVSAGGVALGVGCLIFFLALGGGLSAVVGEVFPVSTREVEVVAPQVSLGAVLGERKLTADVVAQLGMLPGVERAFPKMSLRIPAVTLYNGSFFGKEIRMGLEVIAVGMPAELLGSDVKRPFVDPGEEGEARGTPIPVVANRRLLEIYNKVFAPQRGLPRLTDSMITGFTFPVVLGRSFVAARTLEGAKETGLMFAGFSDRATLAGVSMPLSTVRRLNARFGMDAETYSSVLLRARRAEDVNAIAGAVSRLGFELDESERNRALQIGEAVKLAAVSLSLLAALITALAAVNIAQALYASVRERKREIGVLRAVGATQGDVQALFLGEAAAIGLCGGLAGVLLARLAGLLLDYVARTRLPDFPFKPHSFFHFEGWMVAAGILVAISAALAGAFLPARAAARLDPAAALGGG